MKRSPHPFTLRQLQYAIAIGDALSFRKAAALCHVSQPSLSAQLAQLEEGLGVRLFERSRSRVLPTPAGRELLDRARRLLLHADDLEDAARRAVDPLSGTLRVGVIPTVAPYWLPEIAPALRRAFPRLTLLWQEDKTAGLVRALESGEIDAALLALEADLGDVEHEVLAKDPFVLAASAGHPLVKKAEPVQSKELRGAEVLLLAEGHCFRDQALEVCTTARAREGEFRATSLATLVQMVAGGAGVTLLPGVAVATEGRRAKLRMRPMASEKAHRTLALVWRRRSPLGPALREIAAHLRAVIAGGE